MPKRSVRVNELIKREISNVLHTDYRNEAVCITITEVETSPDLRSGRVFYSVVGGDDAIAKARDLFKRFGGAIGAAAGKVVVLKYFPKLRYVYDPSHERGLRTIQLLDELDQEEQGSHKVE